MTAAQEAKSLAAYVKAGHTPAEIAAFQAGLDAAKAWRRKTTAARVKAWRYAKREAQA